MTAEDKKHLLENLTDSHSGFHSVIEGFDPERCVYQDSDWRIRDIIGHIVTWERQVEKSFRAYQSGTEYAIPDLEEDDFNERSVEAQRSLSSQQVYQEWEQACEDLIDALEGIPLDLFPGDLLFPWGDERGSIAQLVEFLTGHDTEHRDEIVKAVNKG